MRVEKKKAKAIHSKGATNSKTNFMSLYEKYVESEDDYISFSSKSKHKDMRILSNFDTGASIEIDGRTYPSGEHAFQGSKFFVAAEVTEDPIRKERLLQHAVKFEGDSLYESRIKSAHEAQKSGKKNVLPLSDHEIQHWNSEMQKIQYTICREKVRKSPDLVVLLLFTDTKYLVHQERLTGWPRHGGGFLKSENSPFNDGKRWLKGDNILGKIWMEIRDTLKQKRQHENPV